MPRFGSSFDQVIEKVTSELNTAEDWGLIMEICDKVSSTQGAPKECLRGIIKRLNNPDPHVVLLTLTLLDACIKNCGKSFHLEVCSRSFEEEIKKIFTKGHPKVVDKLRFLIQKWIQEDFKDDPQLSLMTSLYNNFKTEGMESSGSTREHSSLNKSHSSVATHKDSQQEDEERDLAKAIELSLKETSSPQKSKNTTSLYPTCARPSSPSIASKSVKEPQKVRALYDFEAVEDNELTFKAGEIILVSDNTDPNWWKGSNHCGEGLFPANFVTLDLSVEPESIAIKTEKKEKTVQFSEDVKIKTMDACADPVEIDEEKIDELLHLIHESDPTGEQPDSDDLYTLEEQCMVMGPLIDQELEQVDRRQAVLTNLSQQLMEALDFYHSLMREAASSYVGPYPNPPEAMHYAPSQQTYAVGPTGAPTFMCPEHYPQLPVSTNGEHFPPRQISNLGHNMQPGPIPIPVQYSSSTNASYPSISVPPTINSTYVAATQSRSHAESYYPIAAGPQNPIPLPQQPL